MKNNYLFLALLGFCALGHSQGITFTPQSFGGSSTICSGADMNGDYLDDIVTVSGTTVKVYRQKTVGGFEMHSYNIPALGSTPGWSIAAGDYDNNGYNDLVFGGGSRVAMLKANSTGDGYTELTGTGNTNNFNRNIFTQRTNFVDINNDGNVDLFACHDVAQSHVYRNDGAGNMIFDVPMFPTLAVGGNYASVWVDYDNDGDMDMYEAKCRGGAPLGDLQRINLLYRNNGDGTFTEVAAAAGVRDGAQSWSTAWADYDNDGDMDFILSNISDENRLYRNNGDGTFTDVYAASGIENTVGSWEVQQADFNNDGFVDFLWQNGKQLWLNNGDMTFTGYNTPMSEGAIGDFNNDGFLDVQYGSNVYYNSGNPNKWLTVKLQGTTSNRNGIGARLELYGAWGKQIRDVKSGEGFSHMNTLNQHFGIGSATSIDKLIIRWPSGAVDEILNPSSNQSLMVVEGSSPLKTQNFTAADFSVSPNPATDVLNISLNGQADQIASARVFDLSGRSILNASIVNKTIDIRTLSTGAYLLVIKDVEGKQFSKKFIKK